MEKANYYKINNGTIICNLCPHHCLIEKSKTGKCNVRINVGNELKTMNYGKLTAIAVDPVEKKPLFHFFPGKTTLSIGSFGCNFKCLHCQNADIANVNFSQYDTYDVYPETLIQIAKDKNSKIISYTYNEPTVYFEYMRDCARLAKKEGLYNVMVTNGFIEQKPLEEILEFIDAFNIDLKAFSGGFYSRVCDGSLEPVLNTIKFLVKNNKHIELTYLIIPNYNDSKTEIENMVKWVAENLGKEIPVHFSRFFPMHKMQDKNPTDIEKLKEAQNIAKSYGIKYVYVGNIADGEIENSSETLCPSCKKLLIKRSSTKIGFDDFFEKNKKCQCGHKIKGIFSDN